MRRPTIAQRIDIVRDQLAAIYNDLRKSRKRDARAASDCVHNAQRELDIASDCAHALVAGGK